MATRTPLVQNSGDIQQLQSGDPVSPMGVAVLRVLDASYTMPANTSLTFLNSLTLSNSVTLTIPDTCTVLITTGGDGEYWTAQPKVGVANFVTTSLSLVNITGLTYAAATNSLYEVECVLRVQSADASGFKGGAVAFSGSGATGHFMFFSGQGTDSGATTNVASLGTASSTTIGSVANTTFLIFIKGIVVTTTGSGNITTQIIKAGGTGNLTVYFGSIMKIKKLS